jgi:hypothetical protein
VWRTPARREPARCAIRPVNSTTLTISRLKNWLMRASNRPPRQTSARTGDGTRRRAPRSWATLAIARARRARAPRCAGLARALIRKAEGIRWRRVGDAVVTRRCGRLLQRLVEPRGFEMSATQCATENFLNDIRLGVGVVLNVPPRARGQFPFGLLVKNAIVDVGAKPIAKGEHPIDLDAPGRKHVEIDVRVRSF